MRRGLWPRRPLYSVVHAPADSLPRCISRPCYVPVELLEGWEITARKWHEGDDLSKPVGRNRRVDRAARGAKVEEVY